MSPVLHPRSVYVHVRVRERATEEGKLGGCSSEALSEVN